MTSVLAGSQALGLTRMNIPFMLGTMVTPDRDRAKVIGFGMHLINGWLFATIYAAAFRSWQRANWWLGALIGLVHALFVLTVAMSMLPGCTRAWPASGGVHTDAAAGAARLPCPELR